MQTEEIHALIIGSSSGPKIISVSQKFRMSVDASTKTIEIVENTVPQRNFESRVRSLHTLYGENGSGKTELLLQIASTFAKLKKPERVGVLYSTGNSLMLYKGHALGGRWSLSQNSLDVRAAKTPPLADPVFYTTSPFEGRRRRSFNNSDVLDVSPQFGGELSFDGFALLDSFAHVRDKAPFLEKLRISVRARIPSTDLMIQRVMELFKENQFSGFQPKTVRLQLRTWLSEMRFDQAEVTLLNLQLITSISSEVPRSSELGMYFAQRIVNLMGQISEQPEFEGLGAEFAKLCENYVSDFPKVFEFSGEQLWRYLRTEGGLLQSKTRVELYGTPADIDSHLSANTLENRGIAKTLEGLGLLQFRIKNLSSGETAFLMLYASLASALSTLEQSEEPVRPVFILLDEGEMFLHPSWQRRYITNVLDFISKFPKVATNTHLFLSTHSLIVAADAPPNTLFDVTAGEMRNGFGLGPGAVLSDVYHVDRFAGANASALIDQLIDYLRNPAAKNTEAVRNLAEVLADRELQRYVQNEMTRRAGV